MAFSPKFGPNLKKKKKSVARMSEHGVYYFLAKNCLRAAQSNLGQTNLFFYDFLKNATFRENPRP